MWLVTVTSPYYNCPLSLDEANEIQNMFSLYDIELYCGIDQYVITNIGIRKFKSYKAIRSLNG